MPSWLLAASALAFARLSTSLAGNDSDLTRFVTRPDIKAPLLDIVYHDDESLVDPGYWFIGSYAALFQNRPHANWSMPCQTGPLIYDWKGEVVWSGACAFDNRVTCDVRTFRANNTDYLSAIFVQDSFEPKGAGMILDNSYEVSRKVPVAAGATGFNMHELTFVNNGTRAIYILSKPKYADLTGLVNGTDSGWAVDLSIHELDLASGEITFEWWAMDHIDLWESSAPVQDIGNRGGGWDWLHTNSVNKNEHGDYLMSARNTNAIYKISGEDGDIIWRLGGESSDFELDGFNFSRQHDAQWLSYDDETEVISFLDNGADNFGYSTSNQSSALIVKLDKTLDPPRASLLQRIWRPDGGQSELRGNFQTLGNGNRLVAWSENAYTTEHSSSGDLLMEASFQTKRFVTYRAYKFPFQGRPTENPVLHAQAFRVGKSAITLFHVSWNGATEVASWRFWRAGEQAVLIGEVERSGFETAFESEGCEEEVFAEAVDRDGNVLGETDVFVIPKVGERGVGKEQKWERNKL